MPAGRLAPPKPHVLAHARRATVHALLAVALLLPTALWATGPAPVPERVELPSLDRRGGEPVRLPGFWFAAAASGEGPARPALLLLHGCGGPYAPRGQQLSERMLEYAAWLNALGVHALVIDSLSPRGENELCTQRMAERRVTQVQRRRDALGALQWLARQPGVDAQRLGLLGWSHGGSTVLAATNLNHPEVRRLTLRPALAVAFYPGCGAELRAGYLAAAPLLLQVGEDDDWTPPEPCRQLAAQASGAAVAYHAYPGAVHGFDGTAAVTLRRDVPNGVRPGEGVRLGGQPEARAQSRERLHAFLRERAGVP
ncbi:MAG: dienelactone hydrolase family protein [Betaproteobacteria bacterium]